MLRYLIRKFPKNSKSLPKKWLESKKVILVNKEKSLLEHLIKAIEYSYSHLGPLGLCRTMLADWDDSKNPKYKEYVSTFYSKRIKEMKEKNSKISDEEAFKEILAESHSESVFTSMLLVKTANDLIEIIKNTGNENLMIEVDGQQEHIITRLEKIKKDVLDALNENAWDQGEYYIWNR